MLVWNLGPQAIASLRALPETGMGFQWVLAPAQGETARFLVFNSELAFDFSEIPLLSGDDPAAIMANGRRVIQALREPRSRVVGRTEPSRFVLLANRVQMTMARSAAASSVSAPQIAQPSSLIKQITLGAGGSFIGTPGSTPIGASIHPQGTFCQAHSVCRNPSFPS